MTKPRLGFLGTGWIGLDRMRAIAEAGAGEIAAIADPSRDALVQAAIAAPDAQVIPTPDDLLDLGLDGIVIATPSALHAEQTIAALEAGHAVFCQKPLGRTMEEVGRAIEAARGADRLLGVDFSYRFTEGMRRIKTLVEAGELGRVFAIDLVFHNAYGPDKHWFYDAALSGGGCLMDLGIHLVDLALWLLGFPAVEDVRAHLYRDGAPLTQRSLCEDYATVEIETGTKVLIRLACSWRLHAGRDAVISAEVHGTHGGATLANVDGSFYDFVAKRHDGTSSERLCGHPDDWGGRAAVDWAQRLAKGERFAPEAERLLDVAAILDIAYRN